MTNKDIIVVFQRLGLSLDVQETSGDAYFNEKLLEDFSEAPYRALFFFGFETKNASMSESLTFLHGVCQNFIDGLSRDPDIEITRTARRPDAEAFNEMLRAKPYAIGAEFIDAGLLAAIWLELSGVFEAEINVFDGTVAAFLTTYNSKLNVSGRVFFHLVENKADECPFAFLATYSTKAKNRNTAAHVPLKNALLEYKGRQDLLLTLLSTVSKAAESSHFISELVESGELFSPLRFTADEAYTFLKEIPVYEECGIMCRIPDWWKKKSGGLKVSMSIGDDAPSRVGLDALLNCKPNLLFEGEPITKEEIESLLSQAAGLLLIKGKWVEVDHDQLKNALEVYERVNDIGDMTFAEAMRMELGITKSVSLGPGDVLETTNGQWLNNLKNKLLDTSTLEYVRPGEGFRAQLRHYQQTGFNWLASMKSMGFGALLADDMGLGKTIQILALFDHLRENGGFKGLLVIPASLIGNWEKELARFAPHIKYSVLHSGNTSIDDGAELHITTYGMALRLAHLRDVAWDVVVLDEAQAVKNPSAGQTKAVKLLNARFKIAMTGTPIENKLSDLWSLFDFLNSGLLGTAKEFTGYAKKIKENGSYAKLRDVVSPFILRRLKTDKAIVSDLPDKLEIKAYTSLTNKQAVLYQGLIDDLTQKLEGAEGIARKGLVLSSIMKFKQICNHPDQYLGQSAYKKSGSGKFDKLQEICGTIYEKRERVLVFTQFREIVNPLREFLSLIFEREGLSLHGGTPVKQRAALVDKFNGDEYTPFMVLSLKAGGVGLNLTAANHVIHFDRWWNPAVENQATDRAFRIGQTKNVMVHKFITAGTVEEKIDAMIEEKQSLSGDIIASSGENWITEMSNAELMDLLSLGV